MGGEEPRCSAQEPGAGLAPLVRQDLGIGQPRVIIDGGVNVVIAGAVPPPAVPVPAAVLGRVAAMDTVTATWA
jgi:hypothetical protein